MAHDTPRRRLSRHLRAALLATGTAVLAGPAAGAQEPEERPWKAGIQGTGALSFGNTEQMLLSGRGSVAWSDRNAEVTAELQTIYGEAGDGGGARAVTRRGWIGSFTGDLQPESALSPFVFMSAETNLEKRIRERYSGGIGAKRTFIRSDRSEASLSLAVLQEQTLPLRTLDHPVPATRLARWSTRGRVRHRFAERVRFSHVTFWQPSVDRVANFLVRSTTDLEYLVTEALSLAVNFTDSYDSEARTRGATSYNDGQLTFGFRAGW